MATIKKVTGELAAIGATESATLSTARAEEAGTETYAYLRIDGHDGVSEVLESVLARREIAAFIAVGLTGDFYVAELQKKKAKTHLLFAFSDGKTRHIDVAVGDAGIKLAKRMELLFGFVAACLIVLGVAFTVIVVGLVPLAIGLWVIYKLWRMRQTWKQMPSSASLTQYLKSAGVIV